MGLYIKGMEMQPSGHTTIRIYADGTVEHEHTERKLGTAVTVPPHGDLIDRDALINSDGDVWDGMWGWSGVKIYDAPTIIPAEGGET